MKPRRNCGLRVADPPSSDFGEVNPPASDFGAARCGLRIERRITHHATRSTCRAFTLVEMLVVIAIIGILASLVLSALAAVRRRDQIARAKVDIIGLVSAIRDYQAENGAYPVSKAAIAAAAAAPDEDFTFGTYNVVCVGPGGPNPMINGCGSFSTPGGTQQIVAPGAPPLPPLTYQANNAEVMAILLNLEKFGNGTTTVNVGHARNPKNHVYLEARFSGDAKSPGVGVDGVYRDPWGNPYIITMDLNGDEKARDALYRQPPVSTGNGPANPLNGLVPGGNGAYYEANQPVMVWSAGPDKLIDPTQPANVGANKDNVLSWKP